MIFGFNTDIKHDDTVYHVQSEAREADLLLQTMVFVKGRCIGKRATSYAHMMDHPDFTEHDMHEMLKEQHKAVLDAIREGKVESVLGTSEAVEDAGGAGLGLQWLNVNSGYSSDHVLMRFLVTDAGAAVGDAQLTCRMGSNEAPVQAEAITDSSGTAEIKLILGEAALREGSVMVQARRGEKSATRKFRLRQA